MSVIYIRGGGPLEGELAVHGAKNSVLPILAACLLARGPVTLHNCPRLTDVDAALGILRRLGCRVEQEGHAITVDPAGASGCSISEEQMRAMRSSIIFLGPLLARAGVNRITAPGHMSDSFPCEAHDGESPLRRYVRVVDIERQ